jgi:hypothetical protein
MQERLIGILKLDVDTYEEIEHDQEATQQAFMVVVGVAVLGAMGQGLSGGASIGGLFGAAVALLLGVIGWWTGAWVTYKVGTSLFQGDADATLPEMLRVLGFAQAPMALGVLAPIPVLGPLASFVGGIWSLCTYFVAVRQGLDISNMQTVITILVILAVYIAIAMGLALAGGMLIAMLGLSIAG